MFLFEKVILFKILFIEIDLLLFFNLLRIFLLEQFPFIVVGLTLNFLSKIVFNLLLLALLFFFLFLLILLLQLILLGGDSGLPAAKRLVEGRLLASGGFRLPLLPHIHHVLLLLLQVLSFLEVAVAVFLLLFLFLLPVVELLPVDGEPIK